MTTKDVIIILRRKRNTLNRKKCKLPINSEERIFLKDILYDYYLAIKQLESHEKD